jgi:hypothetical protein
VPARCALGFGVMVWNESLAKRRGYGEDWCQEETRCQEEEWCEWCEWCESVETRAANSAKLHRTIARRELASEQQDGVRGCSYPGCDASGVGRTRWVGVERHPGLRRAPHCYHHSIHPASFCDSHPLALAILTILTSCLVSPASSSFRVSGSTLSRVSPLRPADSPGSPSPSSVVS